MRLTRFVDELKRSSLLVSSASSILTSVLDLQFSGPGTDIGVLSMAVRAFHASSTNRLGDPIVGQSCGSCPLPDTGRPHSPLLIIEPIQCARSFVHVPVEFCRDCQSSALA